MIGVLLPSVESNNSRIDRVFASHLRNVPISGHPFRAAVERAVAEIPSMAPGKDGPNIWTVFGAPGYRVVAGDDAGPAVLIHRANGRVVAKVLPAPPEYRRRTVFALARGQLLILYEMGGSGISLEGLVYEPTRHGWRWLQKLEEHGELSMQGYNLTFESAHTHPPSFEAHFTDHEMLERYFSGSHFAPGLKYKEWWRFDRGRLRRVAFHQVDTPMAHLYTLRVLASQGRRAAFEEQVPRRFRRRLWTLLAGKRDAGIRHNPRDEPIDDFDDCRDLVVDSKVSIHFVRKHGTWVVDRIDPFSE